MITIRCAEGADIPWLLTQLRQFAEFFNSRLSLMPDDDTAVERLAAFMNPEVGCFYVAQGEDGLLGCICGLLTQRHYFGAPVRTLTEVFLWVDPHRRGVRAASLLLDAYERYGREHADLITMSKLPHSPLKESSLLKRGYRLAEINYSMEIPCSNITAEPAGSEWPALDAQLAALAPVED